MTEGERAEITNGIWLCQNCHKQVDDDPQQFPSELLFEWRRLHERRVVEKVGKRNDVLREEILSKELEDFRDESALARQIIHDRAPGWEFRLTAELLRNYLREPLRQWHDLASGLYTRPRILLDEESVQPWLRRILSEAAEMVAPLAKLYSQELQMAWGAPGRPGDAHEIRHVCRLIGRAAERILEWEEAVRFATVPDSFEGVWSCLPGCGGAQLERLTKVSQFLDEAVSWALENPGVPKTVEHRIVFELPAGWTNRINLELTKLRGHGF